MVTRRPTDEGAFGPDGVMKFFLYLTGILVPVLCVLPWSLPVGLLAIPPGFERSLFMLLVYVPLAVIVVLVLWWAPRRRGAKDEGAATRLFYSLRFFAA